ncbi:MAG: oxygen-insensitive NADPH nitroreductase [Gammaproteobacteria bacterium]|nr:oxygen-insensitive NADPH nitroreductase [Gammaproteobacteria bacterium]
MNQTIKLLRGHRSIRKFTDQPVPQALVNELVATGQAASTSSFIQGCSVVQVNRPEDRAKLAVWSGNQRYVEEAPVFLVFCADMKRHQLVCDMQGTEMLSGYAEQFITATVDCGLFAQNLMAAAESTGLGGCYIGGIRNQIAKVAALLDLPDLVYPVFGMCLGYPDQDPILRPRLPLEVVLKQDRYDDSGDRAAIADYDQRVKAYYLERSGGKRSMTWSEQMSGMLMKEIRPHMLEFLKKRGFLLR